MNQETMAVGPISAPRPRTGRYLVGAIIGIGLLAVLSGLATGLAAGAGGAAVAAPAAPPAPVQQAPPQVPAGTDAVLAPLMNATGYDALRNTAVLGISADTYVRAQGFDARTGQTVTPDLGLIYWAVARYARTTLQGEPSDVVETVLAQTLDVDYSAMTPQDACMWTQQLMGPHST